MTDTEMTIELDRKHRAIRSGERWVLQRHQPDGSWDMVDHWQGGRRSLVHRLETHRVVPSREAEAALERVPESEGFKER